MKIFLRAALPLAALLALSACNTIAGAGQDISAAGGAISHTATKVGNSM